MRRRIAAPVLALLPLFAGSAFAQAVVTLPPMSTITFAPGSTVSTVAGQMAPGGRNVYYVPAKAGQTMSVSVSSAASGITFQVYRPDTTVAKGADGQTLVTGPTLPDAGPNDNAKAWIGALPRDGNYLVLVGTSGSGVPAPTPYTLVVSLQ